MRVRLSLCTCTRWSDIKRIKRSRADGKRAVIPVSCALSASFSLANRCLCSGDAPRPTTPQQYQHQSRVQTRAADERDALQSSPRRRRRGQDENAPPVALLSGSSVSQSGAAFTVSLKTIFLVPMYNRKCLYISLFGCVRKRAVGR